MMTMIAEEQRAMMLEPAICHFGESETVLIRDGLQIPHSSGSVWIPLAVEPALRGEFVETAPTP